MFGIGMQEMVIVGLIALVIFGPSKLPGMARDVGRFVSDARRSVEGFKEDLVSEKEDGEELGKSRDPEASQEPEENVGAKRLPRSKAARSAPNNSRATTALAGSCAWGRER